jgi:hypothetical protein
MSDRRQKKKRSDFEFQRTEPKTVGNGYLRFAPAVRVPFYR